MGNTAHIFGNTGENSATSPAQCQAARASVNVSWAEPFVIAGPAEPVPQPRKPFETMMRPTRPASRLAVSKPAQLRGSREHAAMQAIHVR